MAEQPPAFCAIPWATAGRPGIAVQVHRLTLGEAGAPAGRSERCWSSALQFPGGPGRTTNPADFTSLMDDLEERIFGPMDDATWIYPGHGKDTTLGAERPHLGEGAARGW
jgi:hypothetical protein